ncbi:MAG TPA: DUF6119 family protein [Thermoanaerobaculia bacterium]|nr:DUF6119 family protein [Thermoanaerobaculia bacterium]
MTRSRYFTIYLLKSGYGADNSLKSDHPLGDPVAADNLPKGSILYLLDPKPQRPWWKSYFGIHQSLDQTTKGALVFLSVHDRVFALSFGHVYHYLEDFSYEHDFGLRTTLNCVDSDKIKNTDVLEPGAARRRRTQMAIDSDLTYFDFDRDSTILKSLTGRVKAKHSALIRHVTGSSSLRINTSASAKQLVELCEQLLSLYLLEDYKMTFPDLYYITPVSDPAILAVLNSKLEQAAQRRADDLYLAIPEVVEYQGNPCFKFRGAGSSEVFDDLYLDIYYQYLEENGVEPATLDLETLRRHRVQITDEDGNPRGSSPPIYKCLVYDTTHGAEGATYHLIDGSWYRVDSKYIDRLSNFLDPLCVELPLPPFTMQSEGDYNAHVAANDPGFLCLDRSNISPSGQTQIEACDLYTLEEAGGIFYHVKRSTLSAQLSHLFNQGTNALEVLRLEPEADQKLRNLIQERAADRAAEFLSPIDRRDLGVRFAIITHKDARLRSANLPLFSRISLQRSIKALRIMGVEGSFGFVPDETGKQ